MSIFGDSIVAAPGASVTAGNVDLTTGAGTFAPRFMTDGSVVGCVLRDGRSFAVRWDLFSDPGPLTPSRPDEPCVAVAR